MNNLEQGSTGTSLAQSAHIPQDSATINPYTSRFLAQAHAALAAREGSQEAQEQPAQVAALLRPYTPPKPARKNSSGPIALLGSLEAFQAHMEAQRRPQRQQPAPLEELLDLVALRPKRGKGAGGEGAGELARLLDHLARIALDARVYLYSDDGTPPPQIVMHLPAEMVSEALGRHHSAVNKWLAKLTELGHVQARPHYTTMTTSAGPRTVQDGTLYAVRLAPGHTAHLSHADLSRQYRDLDADRAAGRTAHNAISKALRRAQEATELNAVQDGKNSAAAEGEKISAGHIKIPVEVVGQKPQQEAITGQIQGELIKGLELWAVIPGQTHIQTPLLNNDPRLFLANITAALNSVQDAIYTIGLVKDCPYTARPDLVAALAETLSRELDRGENHAAWCGLIWEAYRREGAGLGGLDSLTRVLRRVMVARREWQGIRNPAALLFAWWRAEVGGPSAAELLSAAD